MLRTSLRTQWDEDTHASALGFLSSNAQDFIEENRSPSYTMLATHS